MNQRLCDSASASGTAATSNVYTVMELGADFKTAVEIIIGQRCDSQSFQTQGRHTKRARHSYEQEVILLLRFVCFILFFTLSILTFYPSLFSRIRF